LKARLRNARYEMDAVLFRTAMSPGIREQHDEFPLIADREGRMVVGQFGSFIDGFLKSYEGTTEEGDIFLTSDPYKCDGAIGHTADWLVLQPICYRDSRLVGWGAMFGHMWDSGGKVPGTLPADATSIFEEGVVIPPVKLYKKGVLQEDLLTLILNQVRLPQWNRSDLNAIVAACRTAGRRVIEMCDRGLRGGARSRARTQPSRHARIDPTQRAGGAVGLRVCDDGLAYGPYKVRCIMRRRAIV
jgi:N-methylhydantoinase B